MLKHLIAEREKLAKLTGNSHSGSQELNNIVSDVCSLEECRCKHEKDCTIKRIYYKCCIPDCNRDHVEKEDLKIKLDLECDPRKWVDIVKSRLEFDPRIRHDPFGDIEALVYMDGEYRILTYKSSVEKKKESNGVSNFRKRGASQVILEDTLKNIRELKLELKG